MIIRINKSLETGASLGIFLGGKNLVPNKCP